jgi:hypothetical protein
MAVLNATGRTAIDPGDLPTFASKPTAMLLNGPLKLYRFFGQVDKVRPGVKLSALECGERGRWWYGAKLLQEMKEDYVDAVLSGASSRAVDVEMTARDGLAVSREWSKLKWVTTITLASGDALEAWVGRTSPQLEWQKLPGGPMLGGGLTQYLIYDLLTAPSSIFSKQTSISGVRVDQRT